MLPQLSFVRLKQVTVLLKYVFSENKIDNTYANAVRSTKERAGSNNNKSRNVYMSPTNRLFRRSADTEHLRNCRAGAFVTTGYILKSILDFVCYIYRRAFAQNLRYRKLFVSSLQWQFELRNGLRCR